MSNSAKTTPSGGLYETDFYAWTRDQAQAIEQHRWSKVDAANVADEIKSLGFRLEREIVDRIEILLSYMLKWQRLAEYRGLAWRENIDRQRSELTELFADNPSLAVRKDQFVAKAYGRARERLRYETYFFVTDFPASCPFSVPQVFAVGYFPEELDAPESGHRPATILGR